MIIIFMTSYDIMVVDYNVSLCWVDGREDAYHMSNKQYTNTKTIPENTNYSLAITYPKSWLV